MYVNGGERAAEEEQQQSGRHSSHAAPALPVERRPPSWSTFSEGRVPNAGSPEEPCLKTQQKWS